MFRKYIKTLIDKLKTKNIYIHKEYRERFFIVLFKSSASVDIFNKTIVFNISIKKRFNEIRISSK